MPLPDCMKEGGDEVCDGFGEIFKSLIEAESLLSEVGGMWLSMDGKVCQSTDVVAAWDKFCALMDKVADRYVQKPAPQS
jgi:hypothetical protein